MRRLLLVAIVAFGVTPPAWAGGPRMSLGAAEDIVRAPDLVAAKAKMSVLRLTGFDAARVTSIWAPGQVAPSQTELTTLSNVTTAARLAGVRVYLSVYNAGSRTTPLTPEARAQFAQYVASLAGALPDVRDVIVGNEPNLNRFWLPQFNPDGTNAAAPAYLELLTATYDAIKAAAPGVTVYGGVLAARGVDRPGTGRDTHSPVKFIRDLGAAYRASGRQAPVMDGFAFHPYPGSSSRSPELPNSRYTTTLGLADYDRLVSLLGQAFDGTAQAGSSLPILYDEFGIESVVPKGKATSYTGAEPATTRPVDETTQAAYYAAAVRLAFCQPNVTGIFLFHTHDEPAFPSWQSGLYYADGAPKSSITAVRDALQLARGGSISRCAGLALDVTPTAVRFPAQAEARKGPLAVRVRCDLDCAVELRLVRVPAGTTVRTTRGYARAGALTRVELRGRRPPRGRYLLSLSFTHPVNPGVPTIREGPAFSLP